MTERLDLSLLSDISLGPLSMDVAWLARELSLTLLLVFLTSRLTGRRRIFAGLFAGAQGVIMVVSVAMEVTQQLTLTSALAYPVVGLTGLVAVFSCGALEWKRTGSSVSSAR